MKASVTVSLKKTVLDPQGKTILSALHSLGHADVADVRQGKYFEVTLGEAVNSEKACELLERIAKDVLANPVIEEYQIQIEE